jgi:hypothetical protein
MKITEFSEINSKINNDVCSKLYNYLCDLIVPFMTYMSIIFETNHIICFGKLIAYTKFGHKSRIIAAFLYNKAFLINIRFA